MGKEVELDKEAKEVTGSCETALDETKLIDVTDVAAKAGFIYPVKISRSLYERCLSIRSKDGEDTVEDRLWMFLHSVRKHDEEPPEICTKQWPCTFMMDEGWYLGQIKVVRSLDAEGKETITLMLPED